MKNILLFPFGGNSRDALLSIFSINKINIEWNILGFFDDDPDTWGKSCCGIKVLGGLETLEKHPEAQVLAVQGNPHNYLRRENVIEKLGIKENSYATIIHPSATVAPDADIGFNVLLMSNVVICTGVKIGNHCFCLPNTVIAHDTVICNYCCFGSNITVSGNVNIDSGCYIGSGSRIKNHLHIGKNVMVGQGSNVVSNVEEGMVVVGNPAKLLREVVNRSPL